MKKTPDQTKEYRGLAATGGGFFGALAGAVGAGPHFTNWSHPYLLYLVVVVGTASVFALIGYLFIEVFVGNLAARGPVRQPVGSEGEPLEYHNHEPHSDIGIDSDH